jgi:AcrR family transcriptional regulator
MAPPHSSAAASETMGDKVPFRARDPDSSKQAILDAARVEFAKAGLGGARVDQIAETSGINKRMIYHYFGGKEQLFAAVVEDAYIDIRSQEHELGLDTLPPPEAMRRLLEFTWDYYLKNPEFITLINSENLHQARHIAGNRQLRKLQKGYVDIVDEILQRGVKSGEFRAGIDPVQLCISMAAICFYYLNNRHTGGVLFGFNFVSREALATRLQFNTETIMRIVLVKP